MTSSGTVAESYRYDAFGVLQHGSSAPGTTYRYTGQQYDAATGLYSLRARYYQPADGRFLTRDTYPIDVQHPVELNRYGYTANNPVNGTDPSGEVALSVYSRTTKDTTKGGRQLNTYQTTVRKPQALESILDGLDLVLDALEIMEEIRGLNISEGEKRITVATAYIDGELYVTTSPTNSKRIIHHLRGCPLWVCHEQVDLWRQWTMLDRVSHVVIGREVNRSVSTGCLEFRLHFHLYKLACELE
ncbi:MAG: RHS repeat-associated core domain-containing protein [Chloroflexaceae bacterium]|nr:RHS repeat-associated core domain-containing protein [Chloroflexaceae bacterium]